MFRKVKLEEESGFSERSGCPMQSFQETMVSQWLDYKQGKGVEKGKIVSRVRLFGKVRL